jgi:hypothetical protein
MSKDPEQKLDDIDPRTAAWLTASYFEIDRRWQECISWGPGEKIRPVDYEKLEELAFLETIVGLSLLGLRKQMGEHRLKLALAKQCPSFLWERAERLLNQALNYKIAIAKRGD